MKQVLLLFRHVGRGEAGGADAPPVFGRSVNPISTRGGTLSPPSTTRPPRFSDLATCLPATTTAQLVYTPNRGNAVQIPIVTIDDDIDQGIRNSHMSQVLEDMGLPTVAPATAVLATAAPETAETVSREKVQEYIDSYDNMG